MSAYRLGNAPNLYNADGSPAGQMGLDGVEYPSSVSGYVTVPPSGDTSGATDYAAIAPLTLAGTDVMLTAGTYYFTTKLIRGFKRNANGTLIMRTSENSAIVGNLVGAGRDKTILNFLDANSPGIEFWTRPDTGRNAAPWINPVSSAAVIDVDRARAWSGGVTGGFTIAGVNPVAAAGIPTASATGWVDQNPNHIGILAWGACSFHKPFDLTIKNFSIGRVTHDTTAFTWTDIVLIGNSVGEACAIQWDANLYVQNQYARNRVGLSLTWRGIYESSAYTKFGREAGGVYTASPTDTAGQTNNFTNCLWVGNTQVAICAADDPGANTSEGALWSNAFNSCYFEQNAMVLFLSLNVVGGEWKFNDCFFETQNGSMAEALRLATWFKDRIGVSQTSLNNKFANFASIGAASTQDGSAVIFNECRFGTSDYGHVCLGKWAVEFNKCYWPQGVGAISGAVVTALGSARGVLRTFAGVWWSPRSPITSAQGHQSWKSQLEFVSQDGGPWMGVATTTTLPTADITYRGQIYGLIGAGGAADTTFQCLKSAADTYSWKALLTG